jgi:hypothetical protein
MVGREWPDDPRLRQCALASSADRAAGARRAAVARWVDADDLAARLMSELDSLLAGQVLPGEDHARWRSGPYRWVDVHRALSRALTADEADVGSRVPHSDTAAWAERGLILDADDLEGQWRLLELDPAYAAGAHRVVLGDTASSGLARATVEMAGGSGPRALARAVRYVCEGPQLDGLLAEMTGEDTDPAVASVPDSPGQATP